MPVLVTTTTEGSENHLQLPGGSFPRSSHSNSHRGAQQLPRQRKTSPCIGQGFLSHSARAGPASFTSPRCPWPWESLGIHSRTASQSFLPLAKVSVRERMPPQEGCLLRKGASPGRMPPQEACLPRKYASPGRMPTEDQARHAFLSRQSSA